MITKLRFSLVAFTAVFLVASSAGAQTAPDEASGSASAEQREEARTRYVRGIELYNEEEYKLALIEFERAYATAPSFRMLYNIGQVHAQLGQYTKAVAAFERYLAEGAGRISPSRVAEVKRDLGTVRARTAKLVVRVAQPGAEIAIDGEKLATSPMRGSELVNAGEHRLVITKDGHKTEARAIVLAGGDDAKIDVSLELEQAREKAVAVGPTSSPSPNRTPMWIAWGTTGALAAGAGTFGILTLTSASELDRLKQSRGSSEDERRDAGTKMQTMAVVADVLTVGAVVSAGIALYLTLRKPDTAARERAVRVAPASASSFLIGGRF